MHHDVWYLIDQYIGRISTSHKGQPSAACTGNKVGSIKSEFEQTKKHIDDKNRILYSNIAARHLFNQGRRFEGMDLGQLLEQAPQPLKQAIAAGKDGLFSIDITMDQSLDKGEEPELEKEVQTYHLSQSQFLLNARVHRLYLFKQLTRELNRQEVVIWKKAIRVISHELNNSLAPISSMTHSGKMLATRMENVDPKLTLVFDTIAERVQHLDRFIQGYAQFSRLPLPQKQNIDWPSFINKLSRQIIFTIKEPIPHTSGHFDPAQMEQVLINLIKNAVESGSPQDKITLELTEQDRHFLLILCDQGCGMSDQVLQSALLPFYSTKQTGTGLGLPLCREIIEAHDGKMTISNRREGGLKITLWLAKK